MEDNKADKYDVLDRPEVFACVFHPRPETNFSGDPHTGIDVMIPVGDGESLGGLFRIGERHWPNLLFFHGSGEIVSDYDPLGPIFNRNGINFLPVDYRGYGLAAIVAGNFFPDFKTYNQWKNEVSPSFRPLSGRA